jgi:hypothetical protein
MTFIDFQLQSPKKTKQRITLNLLAKNKQIRNFFSLSASGRPWHDSVPWVGSHHQRRVAAASCLPSLALSRTLERTMDPDRLMSSGVLQASLVDGTFRSVVRGGTCPAWSISPFSNDCL